MKFTEDIYMRESGGYWVADTTATILHPGNVVVFYHDADNFTFDALHLQVPNVVKYQLESGGKKWHIVGC